MYNRVKMLAITSSVPLFCICASIFFINCKQKCQFDNLSEKSLKNVHDSQNISLFDLSLFCFHDCIALAAWTPQVSVKAADSWYPSTIWQCSAKLLVMSQSARLPQTSTPPPSMLNVAAIRWLWRTAFQHKHTSKDFYGQMQNRSISIFWPYCSSRGKSLNEVGREKKKLLFAAQYEIDILVGSRTCQNKSITLIPCLQQQAAACSLRITALWW